MQDDPLDAFIAELNDMDKQPAPPEQPMKKQRKADVGLDEEADNVADFMEVYTHLCCMSCGWICCCTTGILR